MSNTEKSTSGPWGERLQQAFNLSSTAELVTALLAFRATLLSNGIPVEELPGIKVMRQWGSDISLGPNLRQKSCQFLLQFCLTESSAMKVHDQAALDQVLAEIRGSAVIKPGKIRQPVDLLSRLMGAEINVRKRVATTQAFQEGLYIIYRNDEGSYLKDGENKIVVEMLYITSAGTFGVRIYVINRWAEVFAGFLYPSEDAFYMLLGRTHETSSFRARAIFCPYARQERKNDHFFGAMLRFSDGANSIVSSNVLIRAVDACTRDDEAVINWLNRPEKKFVIPKHMQKYITRVTGYYRQKVSDSDRELLNGQHAGVLKGLHPTEF